jgi:hypothetical protein
MAFGFSLCFGPGEACVIGTCNAVTRDCM